MKNLVFLGAPGSGKGTQSAKLVEKGFEHISTGNLLRSEIAKGTELGNKVKSVLDNGQLVSDDLVVELLKTNLDLTNKTYVFDGYPRNINQAETLNTIIDGHDYLAVYLKVDTEMLVERLSNRRQTKDGKHIYNLVTSPPKTSGVCDVTGEKLIQRDDDKEEVVRKRMDVFEETIQPILDYYKKNDKLVELDASESVNKVTEQIDKLMSN